RVRLADVAEHVELVGLDGAVRHLDANHLVVAALALAVDAVVQPEDAEDVFLELALEVQVEVALELGDVSLGGGVDLPDQHSRPPRGTGRNRSRGRAASVYGRRRQVSSKARCGVTPMAIDGAPRRRSGDRRLDEDLTAIQSTIPDKADQVLRQRNVKLPLTQAACQGILDGMDETQGSEQPTSTPAREVPPLLAQAWETATGDGDPLLALGATRALRAHLSTWEAQLVKEAVADGATWETIGTSVG